MRRHERQRQMYQRAPRPRSHVDQGTDGVELARVPGQRRVEPLRQPGRAAAAHVHVAAGPVLARQPPTGERAPHDHPHAVAGAGGQDRCLDAASQDGIRRLFAPEPDVSTPLGDPLGLDDLLGRKCGGADGPNLAGADQIGEGAQSLVDVRRRVGAMHLVQIDVVGAQPAQAVLHLTHQPAPRGAGHVGIITHREVGLGGEHDSVAPAAQRLADDLLRFAVRVHVRRVDEVDASVEGLMNDPYRLLVIRIAPGTEHHRSQAVRTHLDPRATERAHSHGCHVATKRRAPSQTASAAAAGWHRRPRLNGPIGLFRSPPRPPRFRD